MFVDALLAQQSVAAQGEAVVSREDHPGVLFQAPLAECAEDAADLRVEVRHQRVVLTQLIADDPRIARPGRQVFVATAAHLPIVKRVLGEEVGGQGRGATPVPFEIRLGSLAWVMGGGERDVGEEGTIGGLLLEEADGGVGEQLARKPRTGLLGGQLSVDETSQRHLGVVRHSAKHHLAALLKRPLPRVGPVVPFARCKRGVALPAEMFGQQQLGLEIWGVNLGPGATGHQHGPTGNAHRAVVRAQRIGPSKAVAPLHQRVDVGRIDERIAVGGDGVGPHIVGEQHQHVGTVGRQRWGERKPG